jgi:transcriptional regulator with XRE-family HTH domain
MNFSTWITNQLEIIFDGEEGKITKGAKMFGVSRQTLHSWINGASYPSMARIPILADIISTETNQKYEEIEIQIVLSIIKKTPA